MTSLFYRTGVITATAISELLVWLAFFVMFHVVMDNNSHDLNAGLSFIGLLAVNFAVIVYFIFRNGVGV